MSQANDQAAGISVTYQTTETRDESISRNIIRPDSTITIPFSEGNPQAFPIEPGLPIVPKFNMGTVVHPETPPYINYRTIDFSVPVPSWLMDERFKTAHFSLFLAVPTEVVAEIKANSPESWVITFDSGKWGPAVLTAFKLYQRPNEPYRWLISGLVSMATARTQTSPFVLTVNLRTQQLVDELPVTISSYFVGVMSMMRDYLSIPLSVDDEE